jgi:hypothetical protein
VLVLCDRRVSSLSCGVTNIRPKFHLEVTID